MHKNGIGQSCRKYIVHDVRYERKQREFCFHNIISCSKHLAQRNRSDNTDSWCELFLAKEADVQILGDRITKNFDTGSFDDLAIFSTLAFTPESYQVQNFPCILTSNISSHTMKNLAFLSLLRWKTIGLPTSHCITNKFLYKRLGECTFWTWEWKR